MKKDSEPSLASLIGHSFAHVQHGMDRLIDWGFAVMKEAGEEPKVVRKKEAASYTEKAKRLGRLSLRFFGSAGEAYYEKYDELKQGRQ